MPHAPSGRQYAIRAGSGRATIVEVGAGIREYQVGDRQVLDPYDVAQMCDGAHGAPLIPWPNRLSDGSYSYNGSDHQLPLTEPEKHNAIHGLMRWRSWDAWEHEADRVVMSATLHAMPGYPFALDLRIEYRIDVEGLTVTTTATNVGIDSAPYGCGQHPYLSPGSGPIDACDLQLAAGTRILTDPQRQLPTGTESVHGSAYDFRTPRPIGDLRIDSAFADLDRDPDDRAWVRLTGADGRTVGLWVDQSYPLLELYTGDQLAPGRRRQGLGVEPMTCPPNAFRTGEGLIELEPGETAQSTWGACLLA